MRLVGGGARNELWRTILASALDGDVRPLAEAEPRISQAYREIPELDQWLRRRVRMYYWKQWKRARGRRRNLIRLGIHPAEVYKATRSHRGYWWMAGTSIVQRALDNRWLAERGVPSLRQQWIEMHYGQQNEQFNPAAVNLTGTA